MLPVKIGSPPPDGLVTVKKEPCTLGIPRVAITTKFNAPVHIDVGGTIYTSSLETLQVFPDSKLCKMFNGTIPIVLDTLKQHYLIDRDGPMFRHVLNFLRNKRLLLPTNFSYFDLLLYEASYYELNQMVYQITQLRHMREGRVDPPPVEIPVVDGAGLDPTAAAVDSEWLNQESDRLMHEAEMIFRNRQHLRQRWS